MSQIDVETALPYTAQKIQTLQNTSEINYNEINKRLRNLDWGKENDHERRILTGDLKNAREWKEKWAGMPEKMSSWKPQRLVVVDVYLNQNKQAKYREVAEKHKDDVFVQQIWSCIRQRCEAMDEANKSRRNPMRNIHISLTFTPAETYFNATWDIRAKWNGDMSGYIYLHHGTEYRLDPSGEVVAFKSQITIQKEREEKEEEDKKAEKKKKKDDEKAKRDAEKEAKLLANQTKGEQYGLTWTKDGTLDAKYDDVWVMDTNSQQHWDAEVQMMGHKSVCVMYLGRRVGDAVEQATFLVVGFCDRMGKCDFVPFADPIPHIIRKGRTGKLRDDTRRLGLGGKYDLTAFPK
jgi:hypothetical protein